MMAAVQTEVAKKIGQCYKWIGNWVTPPRTPTPLKQYTVFCLIISFRINAKSAGGVKNNPFV